MLRLSAASNQQELHEMMQSTAPIGTISDDLRHKLHSSSGEQIRQLLDTGEISTEQVLEVIVPFVTISVGGIGGFSRAGPHPECGLMVAK